MPWSFSTDLNEYLDAAWGVLSAEPELNTIGLTVVENARAREAPAHPPELYGWWTDEHGQVAGCVSMNKPWPLLLLTVPEPSLGPLVAGLRGDGVELTGVNGPNHEAATFASIWRASSKQRIILFDAIRLHRLERLERSSRTPGGYARLATEADMPTLVQWYIAFGEEVHHPMADVDDDVRQRLRVGAIWLWCDDNDVPVSLVGRTAPGAGVSRIGPVYTPQEHRCNGYAEVLTHAVSDDLVKRGWRVVLFTDQSNPTSNALYYRLGYRPMMDRLMLTFES